MHGGQTLIYKTNKITVNKDDVIVLTFYSGEENDLDTIKKCVDIWSEVFPNNYIIVNFDTLVKSVDVISPSEYEANEFLKSKRS
jgi:hypothetical protein